MNIYLKGWCFVLIDVFVCPSTLIISMSPKDTFSQRETWEQRLTTSEAFRALKGMKIITNPDHKSACLGLPQPHSTVFHETFRSAN